MAAALHIRQVRATGIDLVPERPTETAAGTMTSTPLVLIDVLTDDPDVTGRSYLRCCCGTRSPKPVAYPSRSCSSASSSITPGCSMR